MSASNSTIILHVGLHKTGSTSIQNYSQFHHRELLLRHGIEYASFKLEGKFRPNHGGPVTAALFEQRDKYGVEWRMGLHSDGAALQRSCREQFDHILATPRARTLLISGEIFGIYNESDLSLLRDRLLQHTDSLRVLVYLRNPQGFVESVVQQRARAGRLTAPEELVGVTRFRYQRLSQVFGDALEVLDFHRSVADPHGLVGSFYQHCGVPADALSGLQFGAANVRSSLEGFRIMRAINKVYPKQEGGGGASWREPRDLHPLYAIPGARFGLRECEDPGLFVRLEDEKRWFRERLGLVFPEEETALEEQTWSFETVAMLEQQIRELEDHRLREAATRYLEEESCRLADVRSDTAAVLGFIARKLRRNDPPLPSRALRRLGPDYFRSGSQQVRKHSPELALKLLRVAQELQPDDPVVASKVRALEQKTGARKADATGEAD